jgi:hypothetical protein
MRTGEMLEIIIESGIVYLFFFVFTVIGALILKAFSATSCRSNSSADSSLFWSFLAGLFVVISLYSILITKGLTVNILVLPVLYFLLKQKLAAASIEDAKAVVLASKIPFLEVGFIVITSIVVLHLFPESEYKQADSFFYLKIAESLNATGQENVSHYNNLCSANFHGLEPYHYFEIWITAFITRFTESFVSSINVQRFVTYGILLTGIIIGLYQLVAEFTRQKISVVQKIFCWSLLFILPNFLGFFPWLYHLFISDFEGNLLERPNFRGIYLLLVPVIIELHRHRSLNKTSVYLLLLLGIVSFKCTLVIIPSMLLYGLWLIFKKDRTHKIIWRPLLLFCVAFAALYMLFPANKTPSLYTADLSTFLLRTVHGFKFILFSITTSVIYIIILLSLLLLPLLITYKKSFIGFFKALVRPYLLLFIMGVIGLLMARILFLKDNAYQFLFITHILVTLFAWLIYLTALSKKNSSRSYLFASVFLASSGLIRPIISTDQAVNTFVQNGSFVYGGAKYSATYINEVRKYFSQLKPAIGGYLADTGFYGSTYYSRRNPNVYFLPITYIIANDHNRNFEFCLSDTLAINYQVDNPLYKEYLRNATSRSFFYQYGLKYPTYTHDQIVEKFIADNHLSYIIVTKDYPLDNLKRFVKKQLTDPNTGERFLIL